MERSIGDMPTVPSGGEPSWKGILKPGSSFGRYKVHRFLGRGGMGEVYEVEHELDGTHYAMKVLSSEIRQTIENIHRFEREAQVMARLQHPNVVSVDYFDETDGKYWFRMELIQGIEEGVVTLGDLAAKNGGRIGQGLLVGLFEKILDGLSCAHEKGVIHRDLKPGNILLAHSEEITGGIVPKISDFGLVRLVGQDWLLKKTLVSAQLSLGERETEGTEDSQGLSTQSLVGTYAYMSPEQKQRKQIDARSDIYAVGLMIYRLLTGYTSPGEKIRNKDATLHAFWQRVVDQSVREDPKDRFSNTAAMLVELQRGRRVLASLDGKASLKKCRAEFQAKRCYSANRYLDEAVMIFPDDPEVLEVKAFMRKQLDILHDLKSRIQDLRRQKKYDDALAVSEQFQTLCVEDDEIHKFIRECPRLIIREQLRQYIEEASRHLEAEEFEAARRMAREALSLDNQNREAKRIHDQAQAMLKKRRIQQTREQVSKGLQKTHSLLQQRRYAQALETLKHTPGSDSHHPKIIALRKACEDGLKKIKQYWQRAEKARASSDYQTAMSLLNEVLKNVAPEDPGTLERLDRLQSEVKELSAALTDMDNTWKNKSYRHCLEAAERILTLQPEHAKAQQYRLDCMDKVQAIQSYVDKAEEYFQNQQYDEAITTYQQTKKYYHLGKRRAKDDAEIESQHNVYSPEYKAIQDRITAIHKAKTSMEQALRRAKERLEAGDWVETRLALDEYFKLQTNGQEGLRLQQELDSLHHRATMTRWIWKSVAYLAVVLVIGAGLTYGTASLVLSRKMQTELDKSYKGLTFENLKETENEASERLDGQQQSRMILLFSVQEKWKQWRESLERSESAWEDYAHGAYKEGRKKLENMPPTEFKPSIQNAFDTFEQNTNELCADVNDKLVKGEYDNCMSDCNAFRLHYPDHNCVDELLRQTQKARKLEACVWDPNIDLISLSDHIRGLIEISPRHRDRQKLEEHCIQRAKSKYDFWDQALPKEVNDMTRQEDQCRRALEDLNLFKQCPGYQVLYEKITDRRKNLEGLLIEIKLLAKAKSLVNEGYWGKAKLIFDDLDSTQDDAARLMNEVIEKIKWLDGVIDKANEQKEQNDWLGAKETIDEVWTVWKMGDTHDSLEKAKKLEKEIDRFLTGETDEITKFARTLDQRDHDQIERFILERIDRHHDLSPVYVKWFPRLDREAQEAIDHAKINTALNLLSRVLGNEKVIRDANDEKLSEPLKDLREQNQSARERFNEANGLTQKARTSKGYDRCPEALWYVRQALKANCEYDDASKLQSTLQILERSATQYWRKAKSLYDNHFYISARMSVLLAKEDFAGDLRTIALLNDLEAKIQEAHEAKENVMKRKMSMKEFFDDYADYDGFEPDISRRIKRAILEDLKSRLAEISQEERRRILIEARRPVLQDEDEYHELVEKYASGVKLDQSRTQNKTNPDWCHIQFDPFPLNIDKSLYIEGHGLKAPNTAFVRCQDKVEMHVSKPSDPDWSRKEPLALEPWKKHQIRIKSSCLNVKEVDVKVEKKGLISKTIDLEATADKIMKGYPNIKRQLVIKSLELALEQVNDKRNITNFQVPLIGYWQEETIFGD